MGGAFLQPIGQAHTAQMHWLTRQPVHFTIKRRIKNIFVESQISQERTRSVSARNNVNDFRLPDEREIAFVDFPVRRLIADNLIIMLHKPAYLLVGIFTETFDEDGTCGQLAEITVMTNRIVGTHGTVRKSLTIKTGLFWFYLNVLFPRRSLTGLRQGGPEGLGSAIKIILVTDMVLFALTLLFMDSLLALTNIKVLVADFQPLFQGCYFRQQSTGQLFIIVTLFLRGHGSLLQRQQFVNLGQKFIYPGLVTSDAFSVQFTPSHQRDYHFWFLLRGHIRIGVCKRVRSILTVLKLPCGRKQFHSFKLIHIQHLNLIQRYKKTMKQKNVFATFYLLIIWFSTF